MNAPFGERAVLPDGRFVTTPWLQPGCYVGDTFLNGPVLIQPDACMTSDGHVWVVAKGHDDLNLYVTRDDWGEWLSVGQPVGSRAIITPTHLAVFVAFTDGAGTWVERLAAPDRSVMDSSYGTITDGSGGNGMRDWTAASTAQPMSPLDEPLNGYLCRRAITYGNTTIALALFDPPQVVIARGDHIGTLALGGADFIRMSQDGKFWAGTRYVGDVNLGGLIPDMIPPLMAGPVMPDVSLVTPARSDFRLGAQMFNNAPGIEPNPHVPFGSFTIPIRLSTLPAGDLINAGQDNGHPISFYAGEDGSQTFAQAVALQRPKAQAAVVGLSLYVDRVPFTAADLALYRPGDVLMPQVNSIAALEPAKALIAQGYPVVLSLGLQQQAPDVDAHLIIAASAVDAMGACIFAKDRSDVPWDAVVPYLDRWNSTITHPAAWPRPEEPMPAFPLNANLIVYTSNVLAVYAQGGTIKIDPSYGVQPGYGQAYQRVTIDKSPAQPSKLRVFHPSTNSYLGIDRVKAKDVNHLAEALFLEPASSPNADTTWLWFDPAGAYLIATGDSTDLGPDGTPARHGGVFALLVVDDAGKPIALGGSKAIAPVLVQGVNVVEGQ